MRMCKRWADLRRLALATVAGAICGSSPGACDLGEFTTTSTVTIDGREVIEYLVDSAILTPINTFVHDRVDAVLDQFEDDE